MTILINLLYFILILGIIVFVHEGGHFMFAKLFGVYVYEFAIGMGPKLFSFKKKETTYSIRLIPIGGFCQLAGEDVGFDDDKDIPKNMRLQSKKWYERFLIMFFGAGNNFILAILLIFLIGLIFGGTTLNPIISDVSSNSPAYTSGLKKNDKILEINDKKVKTSDDIALYLAISDSSKENKFLILRDNKKLTFNIKPQKTKNGSIYGIKFKQKRTSGFIESIKYTYLKTTSIFRQMRITLSSLITGKVKISQLSGPVGIYSVVGEQRKSGIPSIMYLIAFLSINVGFMNLLPLPAFDGGHILFIIIELIRGGKKVTPELEAKIHAVGMALLLLLMLIVTFNDIAKLL